LRGPNWTFYGPFEFWDTHKVVAEYNVNLSEFVWVKWFSTSMPKNMFMREIVGIIVTIAYFIVPLPVISATKKGKEMFEKIGAFRYYILVYLTLLMMTLPIKMVLRWLFSLKYIIALPELELNL
jgi:hypothetical protein